MPYELRYSKLELCYKKKAGASLMSYGGKRAGAGRPKKEPTVVARIPESKLGLIKSIIRNEHRLPLYQCKVQAGSPSPADDSIEAFLDLNAYLVPSPGDTFMVRATGDSMVNAGIHSGNILIVDRSQEAKHGQIVIAALDSELTVKRLYRKNGVIKLEADNPNYQDILVSNDSEMFIWGVVKKCIVEF